MLIFPVLFNIHVLFLLGDYGCLPFYEIEVLPLSVQLFYFILFGSFSLIWMLMLC